MLKNRKQNLPTMFMLSVTIPANWVEESFVLFARVGKVPTLHFATGNSIREQCILSDIDLWLKLFLY